MQHIYKFKIMSSPAELIIYSENKPKADSSAVMILNEAKRLEKKYNFYNPNSFLSKINRRDENRVDFETKSILQRSKAYYNKTDGIFDITVATIKELYMTQNSMEKLQKEQSKLIKFVGCEHFILKKDKIVFDNKYTKIDLGGFVKEYAIDKASLIIKKQKIKSALINFGGDIYAIGKKPNSEKFKIGIKDPQNPNKYALFVEIEDEALTTSASYERNYKIEENVFSHIISKYQTKTPPNSVSVISKTAVESGVYSTALMINPDIKTKNRTIIL